MLTKDIEIKKISSDQLDGLSIDINNGNLNAHIHLDELSTNISSENSSDIRNISKSNTTFKYSFIIVISIFLILLIILAIYFYRRYVKIQSGIEAKIKLDYKSKYAEYMK